MSYWSVCTSQETGATPSNMEQQSAEEMGAKPSLVEASCGRAAPPTFENIQAAYEGGDEEAAGELIQQACCVECSAGIHLDRVRLLSLATRHGDQKSVCYLLKEAGVTVPQEPANDNPAILAAHYGYTGLVKELLDAVPAVSLRKELLTSMLATSCQQGHLDAVRLLVDGYGADVKDCAGQDDEFAVLTGLPLYAAAQAGNEDIANFLLQHGAGFSSYTLMDFPAFSKRLLRLRLQETPSTSGDQDFSVCWTGLQLPWLELDWFLDVSSRVTHLDLSSNNLTALPSVVPWGLIHLRALDLSNNALKELPLADNSQDVICSRLQQANLSQNQLKSLPTGFLHLTHMQKLFASKNQLTVLFDFPATVNWIGLRKLELLDVSDNCLTSLPTAVVHCLKSLCSLDVSRNRLSTFPEPWPCPLKKCKASSNLIETLPNTISVSWRTQLQEVDFSDNSLKELPSYMFELESVVSLRFCGNLVTTLPDSDKWQCSRLKTLDLSRNQLGRSDEVPKSRRLAFLTTWSRREPDTVCPVEFPVILRDSLEVLLLNNNQLECVPQSVCALHSLTELYLSSNPGIRELPAELGQLSNLWQLDIEDLNITNVPQAVRKEGSASVLAFLQAQLRKAEPCKLLKMLVIGPPRQGKTALVEALLTGKASPFTQAECSISTFTWELDKSSTAKNNKDSVVFNVWDVGGPASMTTVNQCFFTDKALYVVIWNLALGEEAVANLQAWLLNIEARAPNSAVVVVGTHLDLIDTKFRTERLATLRAYVLALCRSPSGARAIGYPDITWKHLHEVSCKTLEGLDGLKMLMYHVAFSMKDGSNSACGSKLLDRLIPRSYFTLQEAVKAEKQRRDAKGEVQYLTDAQLDDIIEQNPESDIRDYEDLQTAISFLIETGTVLHFPDTSHGLCTLYFLCPVWLSGCLERIIHLKSTRSVARKGVIQAEDLRKLLMGTGFTQETEEQYFQFLAKFEIALPLANSSYLLPHLLPPKPAMDIHRFHQQANTLQRLFKMSFVPAGFWERFIARMLISLTEMDLQPRDGFKATSVLTPDLFDERSDMEGCEGCLLRWFNDHGVPQLRAGATFHMNIRRGKFHWKQEHSLWGEEGVWTLDDHTNTLLLYHAASYELCATYCCSDRNPLRDIFTVQHPTGVTTTDLNPVDQKEKLEWFNGEVTLFYSEEAGTQIIQHQDSLTDYCSISSNSSMERKESDASSTFDSHLLNSVPLSVNGEDPGVGQDQQTSTSDVSDVDFVGGVNPIAPHLHAFTLLPVNGTLWIPRRGGDVVIIEMQSHADELRGRVIAVLSPPGCSSLGILREAALVAKDTVVCGFQRENMEWCLVVWRSWGCCELEAFYQSYEELGRLESSMRKRR
ncbi:leucine-rich repeat serine/threonine-protein kinase 1 [Xenentodon cancila]